MGRLEADRNRLGNLFFTDEAHFHLCGGVNRQDWIMWADENPHWFDTRRLHPEKLTVWMGVGLEGIVGPFFWEREGTERGINARWMERMLRDNAIPALRQWPNFDQLVFQQDGAPPHIGGDVLTLLDQTFPNRWMGRGTRQHPASVAWPPRSPDLTACDYWLWGYMKGRIFHRDQPPRTLDELRQAVVEVAEEINQNRELRERVIENFVDRLRHCIRQNGGQVEVR